MRFAPSPTGFLHLGSLRSALYNYLFAKSHGGSFILRIEDTDRTRIVPEALEKLQDTLEWAGIPPDEGPRAGGSYGPYIQSQRIDIYNEKAQMLLQTGRAYRCFCTNKRLELLRRSSHSRGETPKYDNKCRQLTEKEINQKLADKIPHVIRFKLQTTTEPWEDLLFGAIADNIADIEGDPVILKTDQYPTYHFANVVDDHTMAITHVLRGVEWQNSTPKHIQLYKAFGWKPPKFAHLPLLVNKDGAKLSKRQGDLHVEYFKNNGYYPESILSFICHVGGGFGTDQMAGMTLTDLIEKFSLSKLKKTPGRLELMHIDSFNQVFLVQKLEGPQRHLLLEEARLLLIQKYGEKLIDNPEAKYLKGNYLQDVLDWAKTRISKLDDLLLPEFEFLWAAPSVDSTHDLVSAPFNVSGVLQSTINLLDNLTFDAGEDIAKLLRNHSKILHVKYKSYMHLLRTAISGIKDGPGVGEMIYLLGPQRTIERLKLCHQRIEEAKLNSS